MDSIKKIRDQLKKLEAELKKEPKKSSKTATSSKSTIKNCKTKKAVEKFTKADLAAFAKSNKIPLKNASTKPDFVKLIWAFIQGESGSDESESESDSDESDSDSD
jgi:hypothetical protein